MNYKNLPSEVENQGFYLRKNKLGINFNDYYLSIEKDKSKYLCSWGEKDNVHSFTKAVPTTKFITISDDKRDEQIINKLIKYDSKINEEKIKEFFDKIIEPLNKYDVKRLLDENHDIKNMNKEFKEFKEENQYKTFHDYPTYVQKEAMKLLKSGKFFDKCLKTISWTHEGDSETATLLLLSVASVFTGNPIHQLLNNEKGKGKTNLFKAVKNLIPDQYILELRNFSDKWLQYNFNTLSPFVIIFIDDMTLNDGKIELMKELTDNNKPVKELRTLIKQKPKTFQTESKFLILINRAKTDSDEELFDRFFLNRLETTENHENMVKNKIQINNIVNNDHLIKKRNLIIKCGLQKLLDNFDKSIIFNPYSILFDVSNHDNRNIEHYLNLIKAKTFYNLNEREYINNIPIGSLEDMKFVLNILSNSFQIQKDKLNNKELKTINHLKKNPKKNTYRDIAKSIGVSKPTANNIIKGVNNNKGLIDKGYVKLEFEEIKGNNTTKVILLDKVTKLDKVENNRFLKMLEIALNNDLPVQMPPKIKNLLVECALNFKWVTVLTYLDYKKIIINNIIIKKLLPFIEKAEFNLKSYKEVCEFIKKSLEVVKNDIAYFEKNEPTNKIIDYHQEFLKNKYVNFQKVANKLNIKLDAENFAPKKIPLNDEQNTNTNDKVQNTENSPPFAHNEEIFDNIKSVNYTSFGELCCVFSEIEDVGIISDSLWDLAYKNKIAIHEELIDEFEIAWSNITTDKPENVFMKSIYFLATGKTKKELINDIGNIRPGYDTETSKIKAIDDMINNNLLKIDNDNKLLVTEKFVEAMKT